MISLHIDRDGWNLDVFREDSTVVIKIGYRTYFSKVVKIYNRAMESQLLTNLEEVMGIVTLPRGRMRNDVSLGTHGTWTTDVDEENHTTPYLVRVQLATVDGTFIQRNSGEIYLTNEEVETLHKVFL